jgi:hypothetical protein
LGRLSLSFGRGQIYDYNFDKGEKVTYFKALEYAEGDWIKNYHK